MPTVDDSPAVIRQRSYSRMALTALSVTLMVLFALPMALVVQVCFEAVWKPITYGQAWCLFYLTVVLLRMLTGCLQPITIINEPAK